MSKRKTGRPPSGAKNPAVGSGLTRTANGADADDSVEELDNGIRQTRGLPPLSIRQKVKLFVLSGLVLYSLWVRRKNANDPHKKLKILRAISRHNMNWADSTTSAPISVPSTIAKLMLAEESIHWPVNVTLSAEERKAGTSGTWLHTVPLSSARRQVEINVLDNLGRVCIYQRNCNAKETDTEFGMTPLHFARFHGDDKLADYLLARGADPELEDVVGRKPSNLTYQNFAANSKAAAKKRKSDCEIPEIDLGGATDIEKALSEVGRLVGEGEPLIVRGALQWLLIHGKKNSLKYSSSAEFSEKWGHRSVNVAGVPYAEKFNVETKKSTLGEFRTAHMGKNANPKKGNKGSEGLPQYVFQQDGPASHEGYDLLKDFVLSSMPVQGKEWAGPAKNLICHPDKAGLNSMHYYMGDEGTGAPFHVHADAINIMLTGTKKWWITAPRFATFSRQHIKEWSQENGRRRDNQMMECVQRAGDLVYVPFDWGHAAINLDDDVFGYTMELTNRRDSFMTVSGRKC